MIKIIAVVSVAVLLGACSTNPAATTRPVSSTLYSAPTTETATVTVTRDSGVLGSACAMKLSIDDAVVARLRPSDSVMLYIPSGSHIISFDTRGGLCPSLVDAIDVNLDKGSIKKYRIRADLSGNYQLLPTL